MLITDRIIIATLNRVVNAYIILNVAINKMIKLKTEAIPIPWYAAVMKARSVGSQDHHTLAV